MSSKTLTQLDIQPTAELYNNRFISIETIQNILNILTDVLFLLLIACLFALIFLLLTRQHFYKKTIKTYSKRVFGLLLALILVISGNAWFTHTGCNLAYYTPVISGRIITKKTEPNDNNKLTFTGYFTPTQPADFLMGNRNWGHLTFLIYYQYLKVKYSTLIKALFHVQEIKQPITVTCPINENNAENKIVLTNPSPRKHVLNATLIFKRTCLFEPDMAIKINSNLFHSESTACSVTLKEREVNKVFLNLYFNEILNNFLKKFS